MKLHDFPPDIVGQILGYDDTLYLSLTLWLVGDRRLHALLASGVHFVQLVNTADLAFLKMLPRYLTNLRALRHLIVNRAHLPLYEPLRTAEVLHGLPDTMETIILRFTRSARTFLDMASVSTKPLSEEFPHLKRLHMDINDTTTVDMIAGLPRTILDLQLVVTGLLESLSIDIIRAMPESVTDVTLVGIRSFLLEAFNALPRQLRVLSLVTQGASELGWSDAAHYAALPRSLVALHQRRMTPIVSFGKRAIDINFPFFWDASFGQAVPPNLSAMKVTNSLDSPVQSLRALSSSIRSLELVHSALDPKILLALPRGLTELKGTTNKTVKNWKPSDLPDGLQRLYIRQGSSLSQTQLGFLPKTLVVLTCHAEFPMSFISHTPRTLTKMRIFVADCDEFVVFPPHLVSLRIRGTNMITYAYGPRTVETRKLEEKEDKKAKKMAKEEAKKREKEENKREKEEKKLRATVSVPTHCVGRPKPPVGSYVSRAFPLSAVPRSVTKLELGMFAIPMSRLKDLPPRLRHLHFDYIVRDQDYDPSDPENLRAARQFMQEAGEPDSYAFDVLGSTQPQVTLFDLFPRTITSLGYNGWIEADASAWSRLPPRLKQLLVWPQEDIDCDALFFMPKQHLEQLVLYVQDVKDEHVKAFPPRLQMLILTSAASPPSATIACIPFIPLLEYQGPWIGYQELYQAWQRHYNALIAASSDETGESLRKLLTELKGSITPQ